MKRSHAVLPQQHLALNSTIITSAFAGVQTKFRLSGLQTASIVSVKDLTTVEQLIMYFEEFSHQCSFYGDAFGCDRASFARNSFATFTGANNDVRVPLLAERAAVDTALQSSLNAVADTAHYDKVFASCTAILESMSFYRDILQTFVDETHAYTAYLHATQTVATTLAARNKVALPAAPTVATPAQQAAWNAAFALHEQAVDSLETMTQRTAPVNPRTDRAQAENFDTYDQTLALLDNNKPARAQAHLKVLLCDIAVRNAQTALATAIAADPVGTTPAYVTHGQRLVEELHTALEEHYANAPSVMAILTFVVSIFTRTISSTYTTLDSLLTLILTELTGVGEPLFTPTGYCTELGFLVIAFLQPKYQQFWDYFTKEINTLELFRALTVARFRELLTKYSASKRGIEDLRIIRVDHQPMINTDTPMLFANKQAPLAFVAVPDQSPDLIALLNEAYSESYDHSDPIIQEYAALHVHRRQSFRPRHPPRPQQGGRQHQGGRRPFRGTAPMSTNDRVASAPDFASYEKKPLAVRKAIYDRLMSNSARGAFLAQALQDAADEDDTEDGNH